MQINLEDPLEREMARQTLKGLVMHEIFCPFTGKILDKTNAVTVTAYRGENIVEQYTCHASQWDAAETEVLAAAEKAGVTVELLDGRELWA